MLPIARSFADSLILHFCSCPRLTATPFKPCAFSMTLSNCFSKALSCQCGEIGLFSALSARDYHDAPASERLRAFRPIQMSIKVMTRVWTHSQRKDGELLVMLALADFANDAGECWPSILTLAQKARLTERQTRRVLKRLE